MSVPTCRPSLGRSKMEVMLLARGSTLSWRLERFFESVKTLALGPTHRQLVLLHNGKNIPYFIFTFSTVFLLFSQPIGKSYLPFAEAV
jgi:hypothetical protein